MVPQSDRFIKLEVSVQASHPALLDGLEMWLRLGLLSPSQVRQLCQWHLVCSLPEVVVAEAISQKPVVNPMVSATEEEVIPDRRPSRQPAAAQSNWLTQRLQSLMAEISVIWLLVLGVFMVVVSSGVLAASQWQNFPPVGQYGILLSYTLAFGGVSLWANRQPNLQITARMLQMATLLIIPVNVWMMDEFEIWRWGLGWIVMTIATVTLTGLTVVLLNPAIAQSPTTRLTLINSIGLSWLHWGWSWAGVPLIATYIGTIGTAVLAFYQHSRHAVMHPSASDEQQTASAQSCTASTPSPTLPFTTVTIAFALLLLMGRSLWLADVTLQQLGLAIGICGWISVWLSRTASAQDLWQRGGWALLLLGWLVSVPAACPWQALIISSFVLWLLGDRLYRHWHQQDLDLLFFIGLQTGWLLWRIASALIPQIIAFLQLGVTQIAGTTFMPWAAMGVVFLGYVVLTLWLAARLRRWQQPALADHAEELAFALGVGLTLLSAPNPTMRVLNLSCSTVILAGVTRRRTAQDSLIYVTHATGVAAVVAAIYRVFPALDIVTWAGLFLVGTIAEWGCSSGSRWRRWRRSAWHLGLVLAAISYTLLWGLIPGQISFAILMSLPIAIALTWLGGQRQFSDAPMAAWLSLTVLLAGQPWLWLFDQPIALPRLICLGIATGLMVLNTRHYPRLAMAVPTVGFGLGLTGTAIWQLCGGTISLELGLMLLSGTVATLWLMRSRFRRYRLSTLYAKAIDGWAIALCGLALVLLTLHSLAVYWQMYSASWMVVVAVGIVGGAIGYRGWRSPTEWMIYSLSWSLELLTVELLGFTDRSLYYLAIANIALGLVAQLLGDWWQRRANLGQLPTSWHRVPLLYGALAFTLRWGTFQQWTGWSTLGLALIAIGIGRRRVEFKPLVYLGLVGLSCAAFEVLFYHLSQPPARTMGDSFMAMTVLGTGILCAYQLLESGLSRYLGLTKPEIAGFAHIHWILSSCLLSAAAVNEVQAGGLAGLGAGMVLTRYAVCQGRFPTPPRQGDIWVYAGVVEGAAVATYALHTALGDTIFRAVLPWGGAIASMVAYFLYTLPWQQWGWSIRPWQRSAIGLPLIVVLSTGSVVSPSSLFVMAGLYVFLAIATRQIRLTYLSMLLIDWLILRLLNIDELGQPFEWSIIIGGSMLYIAQVDPGLRPIDARAKRHLLRSFAAALIGLTALYQADTFELGLVAIGLSIGFILAGLVLKVRAFLYIGTATFVIQVLRQFWLFATDHSLLLWAMGIVLGLVLIWIAGTFEARRSQVVALLQYWLNELHTWA